jgi:hypothetical protein
LGDSSGVGVRDVAKIEAVNEVGGGGTTAAGGLAFHTSPYNSQVVERMRIDSNGNVGIGTVSPLYKLDVSGSIRSVTTPGGTSFRGVAESPNSDYTALRISNDTISDSANYGFSIKYMGTRDGNLNSLSIFSDNCTGTQVEAVSIMQDGNVGIGATSPTQKLEVAGNIRLQPTSGTPYIQITDTGLVNSYIKLLDGTQVLAIGDDGTDEMFSISMDSEFVGVGTLTASANLHVEGSGSTVFKVDGFNGTLFSVDDDLSDSLLSANNATISIWKGQVVMLV